MPWKHSGEVGVYNHSFSTSAQDGDGWSTPRSIPCTLGKDPVPIVQEAGKSGRVWKNLPPPGFETMIWHGYLWFCRCHIFGLESTCVHTHTHTHTPHTHTHILYLHYASWHSSATLTEVFPCFFLSCKANAKV